MKKPAKPSARELRRRAVERSRRRHGGRMCRRCLGLGCGACDDGRIRDVPRTSA